MTTDDPAAPAEGFAVTTEGAAALAEGSAVTVGGGEAAGVRGAHRAAMDHVLAVVAGSHLVDHLVLRGSRLVRGWVGEAAREPADLDWIVVAPVAAPGPLVVASPYGDLSDLVEHWPQLELSRPCRVAWWDVDDPPPAEDHRLDAAELMDPWYDEDEPPYVADRPGGLDWTVLDGPGDGHHPYLELLDLLAERPAAAAGVVLEPAGAERAGDWTYAYGPPGDGTSWPDPVPGVRITVPYRADGLPPGQLQLDFAYDEWLPEPPAHTRVPTTTGDGDGIVLLGAGPELSLAWKLRWLRQDAEREGAGQRKDLHDAVLLAELVAERPGPELGRLLRRLLGTAEPERLADVPVAAGDPPPGDWRGRLVRALRASLP